MPDWMLPHITSYWDERVEAIERFSRLIAATAETDRPVELSALRAAVARHTKALSDQDLVRFAVPIIDDLYKAAAYRTYLDEPLLQYLAASCAEFFAALTARGYIAQYVIDNSYDRLDGPALAFPLWFAAAQMFYICPQEIACRAIEKDKPQTAWPELVTKHIGEAREIAATLVSRCQSAGRHFVYLDIDASNESFPFMDQLSGDGGILVFRKDAPTPGGKIVMHLPTRPRKA